LLLRYSFAPAGTFGYSKAEVTKGGVCTDEVDAKTMMSKKVEGLYFTGEVLDVTGRLGGYNFQWAFSSAYACAQFINKEKNEN
jgi:predicted flavoprotein YhiN